MVILLCQTKECPRQQTRQIRYGDVWTWTAIDADTKLVPAWLVGLRDAGYAYDFMRSLRSRLAIVSSLLLMVIGLSRCS